MVEVLIVIAKDTDSFADFVNRMVARDNASVTRAYAHLYLFKDFCALGAMSNFTIVVARCYKIDYEELEFIENSLLGKNMTIMSEKVYLQRS